MGNGTKGSIGAAGTVVTTAIGVYLGREAHPYLALVLYVAAVIAALYMVLHVPMVLRLLNLQTIAEPLQEAKPGVTSKKGIAVGGDVKDSALGSMGDFYGADAIKLALEHQRAMTGMHSPPAQLEPTPMPILKCVAKWIDAAYQESPGKWMKAPPDFREKDKIAIAVFENPPAPRESPGIPLKDIEVNLKIHGTEGAERINTAYWMDYDCNRIELPPGHERAVVLGGLSADGLFISFENSHIFTADGDWRATRLLGEEKHIKSDDVLKIEVNLVEGRKPHRTVDSVTIEIDVVSKDIQVVTA